MASVSTYLNFPGTTEEAFNFYREVFGSEFAGDGFNRFGDMPQGDGPPMDRAVADKILHVSLPILGGHMLMGSDNVEGMGGPLIAGNQINISLHPDSRAETDRLFAGLSEGGTVTMPLQDVFWGDYYGSCTDRYGIDWMFNCAARD